jgi:hypothetical protein
MTTVLNNGQPVTNEAELNTAIEQADNPNAASGTTFEIDLSANADIELTTALEAISLQSGVTLDIVGNSATLDGENDQRGLVRARARRLRRRRGMSKSTNPPAGKPRRRRSSSYPPGVSQVPPAPTTRQSSSTSSTFSDRRSECKSAARRLGKDTSTT